MNTGTPYKSPEDPVTLYSLSEEILLNDATVIIANLHGDDDHNSVRESIKNHPNFKQNYQLFVEHLFTELQKALAEHCKKINLRPLVEFTQVKSINGVPTATCDYTQDSFDALMALAYLPLHSKYDYGGDDLEIASHTYFLWEQLDSDFTYLKLLELFDISN